MILTLFIFSLVLYNVLPEALGVQEVESVYFRSTSGELLGGYLQTVDRTQKTFYCEAASEKPPTYDIEILYKSSGCRVRKVGRAVTFTPPCDLVIQCEAYILSTNISLHKRVLLVVKGLPPVRLSGDVRANEGLLEVLTDGQEWRAVCRDGIQQSDGFGNGNVVCKMLGFSGFKKFKAGSSRLRVYPYRFNCLGKENNLHNCPMARLKSNCSRNKVAIVCQPNHMIPPKQSQIKISDRNDIHVRMSVTPADRNIWIGEKLTVFCSLKVELPRLHLLSILKKMKNGSYKTLAAFDVISKARIDNKYLYLAAEYKLKASSKDLNSSIICRGTDSISKLFRDKEFLLNYTQPVKRTQIFPAFCSSTESPKKTFLCYAKATNPSPEYEWTIVSKSGNMTKTGQQLEINLQKNTTVRSICCTARQTIHKMSYKAQSCYTGEHASKNRSNKTVFGTLGYTGRYGIIQHFKPRVSGCYNITAFGAGGGDHVGSRNRGGRGAKVSGKKYLSVNEQWTIVVGQAGKNSRGMDSNCHAGGGGASIMYRRTSSIWQLLIMAGGGGGAGRSGAGRPGTGSKKGSPSLAGGSYSNSGNAGDMKTRWGNRRGGVGAGWNKQYTGYLSHQYDGRSGSTRKYNWIGGVQGYYTNNEEGSGGFGGGGGTSCSGCAGGGGGYSGGGSCDRSGYGGGGGGSYFNDAEFKYGERAVRVEGGNPTKQGKIVIQYVSKSC